MNWAVLVTSILGALAVAFEPHARELATENPTVTSIVAAVLAVLNNLTRSITTPKNPS